LHSFSFSNQCIIKLTFNYIAYCFKHKVTSILYHKKLVFDCVGRTFLYNPLMLFYAISLSLSEANKKSIGSSVASDIRDKEITRETIPESSSKKEEKGEMNVGEQRS
jgi:hypothetical protein